LQTGSDLPTPDGISVVVEDRFKFFPLSGFIHASKTCYAFCASLAQVSFNVIVRLKIDG